MSLHLPTLLLTTTLSSLMISVLIGLVGRHAPTIRGPAYWTGGNTLICLSVALFILSPPADLHSAQWVISNLLIVAGDTLLAAGLNAYFGRPTDWRPLLALCVLSLLVNLYSVTLLGDPWLRQLWNSVVLLTTNLSILYATRGPLKGALRFAQQLVRAPVALFGLTMIARIVYLLGYAQQPGEAVRNSGLVTFLIGGLTQLTFSCGVMLLVTYRIAADWERLAYIDPLTGLLNRRGMENQAPRLLARHRREGRACSLLVIDVDHFKRINDEYGHLTGDAALVRLAELLTEQRRPGDVLARLGGEEFCLFLPGCEAGAAFAVAERLRERIKGAPLLAAPVVRCTVSTGIVESAQGDARNLSELIDAADAALYLAKEAGRDRTEMHPGHPTPSLNPASA